MKGHSKVGYYVVKGSQAASLEAYDIVTTDWDEEEDDED